MRKLTKGNQNLKEDVKSLMFPLSGPATVSMDEGLFQSVMGVFYQHEQTVSCVFIVAYPSWLFVFLISVLILAMEIGIAHIFQHFCRQFSKM